LHEILLKVSSQYDVIPLQPEPNDTSSKYKIDGHRGSFAVISTMSQPFCDTCNRMRLTADGKLKNCLFSKEETDLLGALRSGEDILPLIEQTMMAKAKTLGGQFSGIFEDIDASKLENRSMITIGG
jgi:cyclic pyranopterin phosphate synthase